MMNQRRNWAQLEGELAAAGYEPGTLSATAWEQDRQIADTWMCLTCGVALMYRPWRHRGRRSYVALFCCPHCGDWVEV